MKGRASISPCGLYRFELRRDIEPDDAPSFVLAGTVAFLLNNPSTADAMKNDPTVVRGLGYTIAWGFSRMIFVNVNPYRSTDPERALLPSDEALDVNVAVLRRVAQEAELVVCGWGMKADAGLVKVATETMLPHVHLHALAYSKTGVPRHPLYLRKDLRPLLWKHKAA